MLFLALLLIFQAAPGTAKPYFDFSSAGAGFYGTGRELPEPSDLDSVHIGVLGPEKGSAGRHLRLSVGLAIEEANAEGSYLCKPGIAVPEEKGSSSTRARRIPFEMIFHPDDGPWGTAARHVVQFAYEDRVWAIIGGLDGISTHIAELIVSKAWVPVISPGASDASIDYANVPWVFRVVPADTRQAGALVEYAKARGYKHVVVLTELEREAHTGYKRLRAESSRKRFPFDLHFEYSRENPTEIVPRLLGQPIDSIILWGGAESAISLIQSLRKAGIRAPILGPSALALLTLPSRADSIGELIVASSMDLSRKDAMFQSFIKKFEDLAGEPPSPVAFYSYDVARLVIQAVRRAGLNRARIRDELSGICLDGITGGIRFNSLGGNPAGAILLSLHPDGWERLPENATKEIQSGQELRYNR